MIEKRWQFSGLHGFLSGTMNISRSTFGITALLLLLPGCSLNLHRATTTQEQSFPHLPGMPVKVETQNGAITIIQERDLQQVEISARITAGGPTQEQAEARLAETVLKVTRDAGQALKVTVSFPQSRTGPDSAAITVRLPDAEGVEAATSNGSITVTGLGGPLEARSSNGKIQVEGHKGPATVRTSNGAIRIFDHSGSVSAQTSNGAIEISLTADQPGPLDLRTSNGAIDASVGVGFAGAVSMNTSNGSITVGDPAGIASSQESDRRSATVRFKNPGEPSEIRTSNGRIHFQTTGPPVAHR
jgi:hypothetical protein